MKLKIWAGNSLVTNNYSFLVSNLRAFIHFPLSVVSLRLFLWTLFSFHHQISVDKRNRCCQNTKINRYSLYLSQLCAALWRKTSSPKRQSKMTNQKIPKIWKLVLTGGPCGGKTTGQARLSSFFENLGWKAGFNILPISKSLSRLCPVSYHHSSSPLKLPGHIFDKELFYNFRNFVGTTR